MNGEFCDVRSRHRAACRAAQRRGPGRAVDARRQPDQVAPGPHDLVLRDVRARPRRRLRPYDARFGYLFNSYYEAVGARHAAPAARAAHPPGRRRGRRVPPARRRRGARRSLDGAPGRANAPSCVELGLHHEQQHQELLLTDIKHALLAATRCRPAVPAEPPWRDRRRPSARSRVGRPRRRPRRDRPRRRRLRLRQRGPAPRRAAAPVPRSPTALVTSGEWLDVHGRRRLPAARAVAVRRLGHRPGRRAGRRRCTGSATATACGRRSRSAGCEPVDAAEPVCHVSYYEADAFARWAGARLPTEAEWETVARPLGAEREALLDPTGAPAPRPTAGLRQLFGDVWEWTASPYLPTPASGRPPARSASTTASSCATSSSCAAAPASRRRATSGRPTATSSRRTPAGPSAASGWPRTDAPHSGPTVRYRQVEMPRIDSAPHPWPD